MASETEVLEPEVIPPGAAGPKVVEATGPGGINPILAGVLIDIVNLLLFGFVGFVAGGSVGYWAARTHRLAIPLAVLIGIATGWYCGLPLPRTVPLATMIGVIIVFWKRWNP